MKRSRTRWSIGNMMVAVAVLASMLALGSRARPICVDRIGEDAITYWSDGRPRFDFPFPTAWSDFGPLQQITWSDESSSWYLRGTRGGR